MMGMKAGIVGAERWGGVREITRAIICSVVLLAVTVLDHAPVLAGESDGAIRGFKERGASDLLSLGKEFMKKFGGRGRAPQPGKTAVIGVRAGKKLAEAEVQTLEDLAKTATEIQKVVARTQNEEARKQGYLLLGSIYKVMASKSYEEALARIEDEAERAKVQAVLDRLKPQLGE